MLAARLRVWYLGPVFVRDAKVVLGRLQRVSHSLEEAISIARTIAAANV